MHDATMTFFGLTQHAFTTLPPEPYLDPSRQQAFEKLQSLVARRGFAVICGPSGSGKTALLHYLAGTLNENHHRLIYVPFAFLEKGQMLQYLAGRMGLEPKRGISACLRTIQQHLHTMQPVNPVIVLDEVEQLETNTSHLLRCLLHDRSDTSHHCTVILAGAESFIEQTLRLQVHEPLRQRITLYLKLQGLDAAATAAYITHHLHSAGSRNELFEVPAVQLIHELSNGLPRIIGTLAEAAMDSAATARRQTVTLDDVHAVAENVLPPHLAQVAS